MFGRNILVLAPHPDDEVVGAATAIRRASAGGASVKVLYLTTGVPARKVLWPWQRRDHPRRVATRIDEAREAARFLGIEPVKFLTTPTRALKSAIDQTMSEIEKTIETMAIDRMWVPAYEGAHQDHDVAHYLGSRFRDRVPVSEYAAYNFAGGIVRSQSFFDSRCGETVIELTDEERSLKRRALDFYESERGNLGHIETVRESFRSFREGDYSRPPHGGTLFYARFQWVPFRHPRVDYTRPSDVCLAVAAHAFGNIKG